MQTADDSLDLDLHPRFEAAWRRAEFIMFGMLALLVLVALAGYLGGGRSLTRAEAGNRPVEYMQTIPYKGTSSITIAADPSATGALQVSLSDSFFRQMAIKDIQPKPSEESVSPGWHNFRFRSLPGRAAPTRAGLSFRCSLQR